MWRREFEFKVDSSSLEFVGGGRGPQRRAHTRDRLSGTGTQCDNAAELGGKVHIMRRAVGGRRSATAEPAADASQPRKHEEGVARRGRLHQGSAAEARIVDGRCHERI
jgi:hypothetical protein